MEPDRAGTILQGTMEEIYSVWLRWGPDVHLLKINLNGINIMQSHIFMLYAYYFLLLFF